ncbi:SMI1/KNR4 family protein [Solirubrobacter soli]|uniref:SMI1/KNR4 family protein n=1 Tax=Solirubrobacter soli TaxID=363832 RepID=UPI00041FCF43|nr:SMI1/KNR4 family protein [Solirubrobacter soli]
MQPEIEQPRLLDQVLLDDYAQRLVRAGLEIVEHMQPGLSEAEIDAATRPLGLRLPAEARTWFGWRNGYRPTGFDEQIAPGFALLSLEDAIQRHASMQTAVEIGYANAEWFPIVESHALVVCDCSVPEGAATPIRVLEHELDPDWATPRAASMGEMILMWTRCWDSGVWYAERPNLPQRRHSQPDEHGRLNYLLDV